MNITDLLKEMSDETYRDFQAKLIPNIPAEKIIGVRVPKIRDLAKDMVQSGEYEEFVKHLPHKYYDEDMLHSAIITLIKDYDEAISLLNNFLPFADNWAVCDTINPKVLGKNKERLPGEIKRWIDSSDIYAVRFAIKMLMDHFLGDEFREEYADMVSDVRSEEYYIKMMVAWYFATALYKNYDEVIKYFRTPSLSKWEHNKAIQKAVESRRISDERKNYLRSLKVK